MQMGAFNKNFFNRVTYSALKISVSGLKRAAPPRLFYATSYTPKPTPARANAAFAEEERER
jgi:hypothetical protein